MTTKTPEELLADCSAWWDTAIIDIHPGKIAIRGYPIEELIGRVRFPDMIWLMLRGDLPIARRSPICSRRRWCRASTTARTRRRSRSRGWR